MHPIIKTSYLFCEARSEIQGAGFIIETVDPWYIGRVLTFKDLDAYLTSKANSVWPCSVVPGYMILIQFAGSLVTGSRILVQETTHAQIQSFLKNSVEFYWNEKIQAHSGYYKKFLIR